VALVAGAEPGARLALGLGDLASCHLDGDFGPSLLAARATRQSRQVKPFVGLDQVDRHPAAARRKGHPKLEQRIHITALGVGETAANQEIRTLLADGTHGLSPFCR
jgi:hypothetical protein